jgi:small nuclear ribonucleoprotein D2
MYSKNGFTQDQFPMSLLSDIVREKNSAIIFLRNNKKIIAKVKAFDKHFNLILENIKEISNKDSKKIPVIFKERHIGKMILRGDSVILVLPLQIYEAF